MKYIISILSVLITTTLFANEGIITSSKIESVTVYLKGASIKRTATTQLKKGDNKVILSGLSDKIEESSILVKVNGNISLLSVGYQLNHTEKENRNAQIKTYQDSLVILNQEKEVLLYQKDVYTTQKNTVLINNNLKGTESGFKVAELKELLAFQRSQVMELNKTLFNLDLQIEKNRVQSSNIESQMKVLNGTSKSPKGEILLNVFSNSNATVSIEFEYIMTEAKWTPIYNLRVEDISKPAELTFKTQISQNSSIDWTRVKMIISNGNPSLNQDLPYLSTLNAEAYDNIRKYRKTLIARKQHHGYYRDPRNEPKGIGIDKKEKISEVNDEVSYKVIEKHNQITTEYEINIPQTILADNQDYLVNVTSYDLPSSFHYYAIPKVSKNAYLLAEFTDWGKYNLLPSDASIFFEGTYVGKTFLDPSTTDDTLAVSMGIDKNVQVKRTDIREKTGAKLLGLKRKLDYIYEFDVLNNKRTEIEIEIVDQIPIATQDEVEVILEKDSGGKLDPDSGEISWKFKLDTNKSKNWKFHYSIKYPKNKSIRGTR